MESICLTCGNFFFICTNCAHLLNLETCPTSQPTWSVDATGEVCIRCGGGGGENLRLISRDSYIKAGGRVNKRKVHSARRF